MLNFCQVVVRWRMESRIYISDGTYLIIHTTFDNDLQTTTVASHMAKKPVDERGSVDGIP